jgi:hypothetical protein
MPDVECVWPFPGLRYNRNPLDSHWMARLAPKMKPSDIQPRASTLQFTARPKSAKAGQPGKQILTAHWMPPKPGPVKVPAVMVRDAKRGTGRVWAEAERKGTYWVRTDVPTFPGEMRVGTYTGSKLSIGDRPYGMDGNPRHDDGSPCRTYRQDCKTCKAAEDVTAVSHGTGPNGEPTITLTTVKASEMTAYQPRHAGEVHQYADDPFTPGVGTSPKNTRRD